MKVYLYDEITKEFIMEEDAHIDPLETKKKGENVYLLPANATFKEPMQAKEGFKIVFNGKDWEYQEIKVEKEKEPTNEDISQMRQGEYMRRTDPLTLRKLRKQALGEWTSEDEKEYVAQIKAISEQIASEFPYNSEEPNL
mgnify:CR=1 FL=1